MRRIRRRGAPNSNLISQSVRYLDVIKLFFPHSKFCPQQFSSEKLSIMTINEVKLLKVCFILEIPKMSIK
jgi:hypothetical protein